MRYFRKMTGERLYLSPVNPDDAETYQKWMNDKVVASNFHQYHWIVSSKNEMKWLFEPPSDTQRYAMVLLNGDVMIGCISLQNIDHRSRNAFIGIFIGEEEHRGKGYGAEAIRLVLEYGFKTMNLHNIMLSVHADNQAGIACYKKVGFRECGRRRDWIFKDGKYIDTIYMDILDSEFGKQGTLPFAVTQHRDRRILSEPSACCASFTRQCVSGIGWFRGCEIASRSRLARSAVAPILLIPSGRSNCVLERSWRGG